MWYAKITYRQRAPDGSDLPIERCETTQNGPFTAHEGAERFITSVADKTPVFRAEIVTGVDP